MTTLRSSTRATARGFWVSRAVIIGSAVGALGTLFLHPNGPISFALDVLLRTYLVFVGLVMAHEGSHGHLGRTRATNFWWGRCALVPALVPYTNFRKTHRLHHAHTNDPHLDPDFFVRPRRAWQTPLRLLAMPHHWFFWLRSRGHIRRGDFVELAWNYIGLLAIHGTLVACVGAARYFSGVMPALVLVSVLLWYPFAIKTHEGRSMGAPATRSHSYYGRFLYWFSLGLSVHRAHHLDASLTWLDLRAHIPPLPPARPPAARLWRDIRLS